MDLIFDFNRDDEISVGDGLEREVRKGLRRRRRKMEKRKKKKKKKKKEKKETARGGGKCG